MVRGTDRPRDGRTTRRGLLAALGGSALSAATATTATADRPATQSRDRPTPARIRVRTYADDRSGWSEPAVAAHRAVARAVAGIGAAADRTLDRAVAVEVTRGPQAPRDVLTYDTQDALLSSFRDWLHDTGAPRGPICHLLLADAALNPDLGYGGSSGHVSTGSLGARTVANVGATESFDDRAVTRSLAIHEALHPLVAPTDAEAVVGSDCEHDLGAVVRLRPGEVVVTPMATSYAAPEGGTETRFHGSGCSNHESFSRYERVRPADAVRWHHTPTPSPATRAAVTRFVSRTL